MATYRFLTLLLILLLSGCTTQPEDDSCASSEQGCQLVEDANTSEIYRQRTWVKADALDVDLVELAMKADIQIQPVEAKIIGSSYEDSVASLASKIWLIDNAQHSVDVVYYIFSRDLVGYALLGALCEAIQRGVDVRVMVDSAGSYHPTHSELKALENCAKQNAGYIRNAEGQQTTLKARGQVVVFNAMSKVFVNYNRRSHDKLLVVDGSYPEKAWVMTGGRNISLSYYGFKANGEPDPKAYRDLEIVLRPQEGVDDRMSVGKTSEIYYSILFSNTRNKRLSSSKTFAGEQKKMRDSLASLRDMVDFKYAYDNMEAYLEKDLHPAKARLAHELHNMVSKDVVAQYSTNMSANRNSIVGLMDQISELGVEGHTVRVVSPYLFIPEYIDSDGNVYHDGQIKTLEWLEKDPRNRLIIVTNSVLTSDNFFAQAIIDMDTAPRLLLSQEMLEQWRKSDLEQSELNPELVKSDAWKQMINNPRIKIYQTGRLDSDELGRDVAYGKLHAKFILTDGVGFVGTTNLDYRSRLFNNEMGFFVASEELQEDLNAEFDKLILQSYLWGSPEWLDMRIRLRAMSDSSKGKWARKQRGTFSKLHRTGLHWLF